MRWRFITHGGIDGYSRLIVYLKCSTNITSLTVYESFLAAVTKYGLPSRVRSDQGGENMLVADHMIQHRGADRNSMIVGASVHNQRIERLWKDMHKCVTSLFYRLFYFMEQHDLLDPLNEKHIYALHYIFLPRINKALQQFKDGWNSHPIRTARNKSPHQLFSAGMILLQHSGLTAMDYFNTVDSSYGIDGDEPVLLDDDTHISYGVEVPRCSFRLTDVQYRILQYTIDPLASSDEYGIDLFEQVIQFINEL